MNQRDCKKCVYYGGKRKGKVFCLNDKCVRGKDRNRRKGNRSVSYTHLTLPTTSRV